MIRESLYFTYAGRKSSEFGIYNVSIQPDLFTEPLMANRNIKELVTPSRNKPHFEYLQRDPLTLTVSFLFGNGWDDDLIDDVIRWLGTDNYEPLEFEDDLSHIYYAVPTTGLDLIHNGLKEGHMNLTFRCDSPFSYSPQIQTHWYDNSNSTSPLIIQLENKGHIDCFPEIDIVKVGAGDISIVNLSNAGQEFKFTTLSDAEEVYTDNENEIITSSLNVYRYDNFNDNYLYLKYGVNTLQLTGSCKLRFSYQLVYLK